MGLRDSVRASQIGSHREFAGRDAFGAGRIQEIVYGAIPQVLPLWTSFSLYRFETNVRSATVLGPDATTTDALSTGVFVLGVQEGLALIETLAGYEAVLVDADGGLHVSSGFD